MLRPLTLLCLLSGATAALADPVALKGDALRDLAGSKVELDTPLGTKLPILFGADGLVSAEAGELAPILGSAKDRGRWWVENDKLCSKWFRWFDAEVRCITVSRDGTRLFWKKDDGETGTATLVEAPRAKPPREEVAATQPATPSAEPAPQAASAPAAAPQAAAVASLVDDDIPLPIRKPVVATASVVPVGPPVFAAAAIGGAPGASPPPQPSVTPVLIARAAPDEGAQDFSDYPMMRFGGAGLLEASARFRLERPAAGAAVSDPEKMAKAAARTVPMGVSGAAAAPAKATSSVKTLLPKETKAARAAERPRHGSGARAGARVASHIETSALYRVRGVSENDVLNIRRGPSETHDLVATIPPTGRRVEVTGACEKGWCPVRYGSAKGWAHSFYLTEESPRQASSSAVYFAKP